MRLIAKLCPALSFAEIANRSERVLTEFFRAMLPLSFRLAENKAVILAICSGLVRRRPMSFVMARLSTSFKDRQWRVERAAILSKRALLVTEEYLKM